MPSLPRRRGDSNQRPKWTPEADDAARFAMTKAREPAEQEGLSMEWLQTDMRKVRRRESKRCPEPDEGHYHSFVFSRRSYNAVFTGGKFRT